MGWRPYLIGTRLTAEVRAPDPLARAKELIAMRGPVLDLEKPDHLEFTTPGLLFVFINPFALVSRTVVRVEQSAGTQRLVYELKHPIDLAFLPALALFMFEAGTTFWPVGPALALYAFLHSGMLWFMHRDLLRAIAGGQAV